MKEKHVVLLESIQNDVVKSHKVDLNRIAKLINSLNDIMAPVISKDVLTIKKELDNKAANLKKETDELQTIGKEILSLKDKKNISLKKIKVVTMLSDLCTNYKISNDIKKECLSILQNLDAYTIKRLNLQIKKLENVLGSNNKA